jgi:nicotinamidase-related amidase
MQLDPDSTAVVVVDVQNGFCHPDGSLYAPGSEGAIEHADWLFAETIERSAIGFGT